MVNTHVLIPLDGSSVSHAILKTVAQLFDPDSCNVTLLRVGELPEAIVALPPHPIPFDGAFLQAYDTEDDARRAEHPIYADQARDSRHAELEAELLPAKHELEARGFKVELAVAFGDPAEEIVSVAVSERADMIAMSTHGRTGLGRIVMGSVAENVLQQSDVPVLLVRPHQHLTADATASAMRQDTAAAADDAATTKNP